MDERKFEVTNDEDLLALYASFTNSITGYEDALAHFKQELDRMINNPHECVSVSPGLIESQKQQISVIHNLNERVKEMRERLIPIIKPMLDEKLPEVR